MAGAKTAFEKCESDLFASRGLDLAAVRAMRQPPRPIAPERWVSNADYPAKLWKKRIGGVATASLDVDVTGKPKGCHLLDVAGDPLLGQVMCEKLMERARFSPGLSASGAPVASPFIYQFKWAPP